MNVINVLRDVGINGVLDIAFMTLLIYTVFVGFKRTRAAFVLTGIFILAGIYLLTRQFGLVMTASVFEKFFAVILIILVVIFQEELRHFFEEIAVWSLNRRIIGKKAAKLSRTEVEVLVRTLMEFSREKIGALIVLRGKNIINRHLDGEIGLNGELSEPLLKSIFDPHSAGHDGAVVIDGNRVVYFACHLPLSKNLSQIKNRGTRHAAALGLSEVSDALCLVVSEEKGTISVTQNGSIRVMNDPEKLTALLDAFYDEINPTHKVQPWEELFKKNTREKIYAFLFSLGLWFVLVYGSKVIYKSYLIPVSYGKLAEEWVVATMEPKEVAVTFQGPRAVFYFRSKDEIKLFVNLKMKKGTQDVRVHADNFVIPKELILEDYNPNLIEVTLEKRTKTLIEPNDNSKTESSPDKKN